MDDYVAEYYTEDDDGGFEDYSPTTVDPGPILIIGTLAICFIILLIFYVCQKWARRRRKLRKSEKAVLDETMSTVAASDDGSSAAFALEHDDGDSVESNGCEVCFILIPETETSPAAAVRAHTKRNPRRLRGAATLMRSLMPRNRRRQRRKVNDGIIMLDESSVSTGRFKAVRDGDEASNYVGYEDAVLPCGPLCGAADIVSDFRRMDEHEVGNKDVIKTKVDDTTLDNPYDFDRNVSDITDKSEPINRVAKPRRPRGTASKVFRKFRRIARYDREMKRLVNLAVPYTLSAIFECIFGLLQLAVIGKLLGTRSLSAYIAVDFLLTLTSMWLEGAMSSLLTVCSQAIGAGKPMLAGQYVQIAVVTSQILFIPQLVFWMLFIDDAIIWLGFDEETASIGSDYATVVLFHELYGFAHDGMYHLLDVCDHERFSAIMSILYHAVEFGAVLAAALLYEPSLRTIGIIHFGVDLGFFCFGLVFIQCMGWFRDYWSGLIGSCALGNFRAVKYFFQISTPLSLGYVLTNGEWEVLFLLASVLGPAEVAAWGILGEIWDALETVTLAVADAAEVRCAYLLGAEKPKRAQRSAHKSLFLGVIIGAVGTAILIGCSASIPEWMTSDHTLQVMIRDLLPLVGMGNFMLTLGSVSWILLGAQGRYALSTGVAFIGSWFVTLPLALLSTLYFGYDLTGLAAAVVLGYMVSGMINTLLLLDSDWEDLSMRVQESNDVDFDDEDSELPKEAVVEETVAPVSNEVKSHLIADRMKLKRVAMEQTSWPDEVWTAAVGTW